MTVWRVIAVVASGGTLLLGACNNERTSIGFEDDGKVEPSFTPPADGGDAGPVEVPLCLATECPAPYATCGDAPSLLCTTNLLTDKDNCGACGFSCGNFGQGLNLGSRCVNGKCAFECISAGGTAQLRDCNGILDDGCETDISWDAENCGACGNVCPTGVRCVNQKCGCPVGQVDCNGTCTNTREDAENCGACGIVCEEPEEPCDPMPANTFYTCVGGKCGQLDCFRNADCNHDLNLGCASDGCETNVRNNPLHCGGCGIVCGPGQECRDDGSGMQCLDTCEKTDTQRCSSGCRDLRSDPANCGACGNVCPVARAHQVTICNKGLCDVECESGFADCNADPLDGCETDLRNHPANCGACGRECNLAMGQPCVEGKCLMAPCDAGVVTK